MVHNASSGNGTVCGWPVWGHAVSSNLSHWTHLPVALWNDEWWDLHAVYSGSTTIVDGVPTIIYAGICDPTHARCPTHWGVGLAAAMPANASDPFRTEWQKRGPLVLGNEPLKDPSAAWQTAEGEWRLPTAGGMVYRSDREFKNWSLTPSPPGSKHLFRGGECPSFFPLPKLVPGRAHTAAMPTHVLKYSHGGSRDYMVLGTYDEGPPTPLATGLCSVLRERSILERVTLRRTSLRLAGDDCSMDGHVCWGP